jgi:hypothetical protein
MGPSDEVAKRSAQLPVAEDSRAETMERLPPRILGSPIPSRAEQIKARSGLDDLTSVKTLAGGAIRSSSAERGSSHQVSRRLSLGLDSRTRSTSPGLRAGSTSPVTVSRRVSIGSPVVAHRETRMSLGQVSPSIAYRETRASLGQVSPSIAYRETRVSLGQASPSIAYRETRASLGSPLIAHRELPVSSVSILSQCMSAPQPYEGGGSVDISAAADGDISGPGDRPTSSVRLAPQSPTMQSRAIQSPVIQSRSIPGSRSPSINRRHSGCSQAESRLHSAPSPLRARPHGGPQQEGAQDILSQLRRPPSTKNGPPLNQCLRHTATKVIRSQIIKDRLSLMPP